MNSIDFYSIQLNNKRKEYKLSDPKVFQKSPIVKEEKAGTYYWCACGQSANQPFCDGSHKGSEFVPRKVEITEDKKVAWCACKNSCNGAFCDGTHKTLV